MFEECAQTGIKDLIGYTLIISDGVRKIMRLYNEMQLETDDQKIKVQMKNKQKNMKFEFQL